MQRTGDGQPTTAPTFSTAGRIAITVLVLLLPVACLALALTSDGMGERAWLIIAGINLVLPAVMLPHVWRRGSDELADDQHLISG